MNKEYLFVAFFIFWYLKDSTIFMNLLFKSYYSLKEYFDAIDLLLFPEYFDYDLDSDKDTDSDEDIIEKPKKIEKYEDKYKEELRKLTNTYEFDEELHSEKIMEYKTIIENENNEKVIKKLDEISKKILKYEDEQQDCVSFKRDLAIKELTIEKNSILQAYNDKINLEKQYLKEATEKADNYCIKKLLERLKNCHVMEFTPFGNVLMIYDIERETFKYYSDNTIPYRFLEVVARKYAKQFNCRQIYIDMEEELNLSEEKNKLVEYKKILELENENKINSKTSSKKSVFAKFKSYNKESGTGHVNTVAPSKNNIQQIRTNTIIKKVLLKEKSNRFTYDGKISNFSFIKKTDRKVIDKKFAMSFSDYKAQILNNTNRHKELINNDDDYFDIVNSQNKLETVNDDTN